MITITPDELAMLRKPWASDITYAQTPFCKEWDMTETPVDRIYIGDQAPRFTNKLCLLFFQCRWTEPLERRKRVKPVWRAVLVDPDSGLAFIRTDPTAELTRKQCATWSVENCDVPQAEMFGGEEV